MTARLVIGGVSSGVGKTTVATGLMAAFRARGLRVVGFKVGPDYIDPSYHAAATGRPSRNLDTWLVAPETVRALFARAAAGADLAIIEGVMGLYDGHGGGSEAGSTAEVAKLLQAPVLLLIDGGAMARSAGAIALGYQQFDPALRLAGVLFNNVSSPRHLEMVATAVTMATGLPTLGALPRDPTLTLPERHLGLVPMVEGPAGADYFARLAARLAERFDLERIVQIAQSAPPLVAPAETLLEPATAAPPVRLALAQDAAFHFYYADALDLLEAAGAELVPFSPLADPDLPPGVQGLYLGGGFPELFGADLAANTTLRARLRAVIAAGLPVYAECGGLMYLGEALIDLEGRRHPMVGALPVTSTMTERRLTMGYRTVVARRDHLLLAAGEQLRGHEFHWSTLTAPPDPAQAAYTIREPAPERPEGFATANLLASYVHVHLASRPGLVTRWLDHCRRYGQGA